MSLHGKMTDCLNCLGAGTVGDEGNERIILPGRGVQVIIKGEREKDCDQCNTTGRVELQPKFKRRKF